MSKLNNHDLDGTKLKITRSQVARGEGKGRGKE